MAAVTLPRPEWLPRESNAYAAPPPFRLRVGVVTDARAQPRWLVRAFADVAASDVADVAVMVQSAAPAASGSWLWRAYHSADHRLFGRGEDLLAPADLSQALPRAALLECDVKELRGRLAAYGLDIVLVLCDVAADELEGVAKYGVWRFGFGANGTVAPAGAAIHETVEGQPVTASALMARLPGDGTERVLCRAWSRNFPLSLDRTWHGMLPKTGDFLMRALTRLHQSGPAWMAECDRSTACATSDAPAARDCMRHVARLVPRLAGRSLQRLLRVDQWFIGFRFGNERAWHGDLREYSLLVPPTDRFWADPFPIERCGRYFIFLEELIFATGKAHISVIEVDQYGRWSAPAPVLERDYHLSYPFLLEHGGELYMIPETGANRTVELYRCVSFPDRWRLEKVLLEDVCSADATLHCANGRWWMFVGMYAKGSELAEGADELHLYYSDDLFGKWRPHAGNPVKSDVRSARPAGALYTAGGALYRPAQIGVPIYGAGVSINRVLQLSSTEFLEREVQRVLPRHPKKVLGLHTVNRAGRFSVIDGFSRRPRI